MEAPVLSNVGGTGRALSKWWEEEIRFAFRKITRGQALGVQLHQGESGKELVDDDIISNHGHWGGYQV